MIARVTSFLLCMKRKDGWDDAVMPGQTHSKQVRSGDKYDVELVSRRLGNGETKAEVVDRSVDEIQMETLCGHVELYPRNSSSQTFPATHPLRSKIRLR